jgi:Peptidase A4 family
MRRLAFAALAAGLALALSAGPASAATAVSSNWSGYAVTGTSFDRVSGSWIEPTAICSSAVGTTSSAFWVGLGGDSSSDSLEQVGTEADCLASGGARYSAWYELVPQASVKVKLTVAAGDRMAASVVVHGTKVTVKLTDVTRHTSFSKTLGMASPDVSSAEWIAEAPSTLTPGGTRELALTDFGTVRFSSASATTRSGHTGTISDTAWTATAIALETSTGGGPGSPFTPFATRQTRATEAVPTSLSAKGEAFSVTVHQATTGQLETFAA